MSGFEGLPDLSPKFSPCVCVRVCVCVCVGGGGGGCSYFVVQTRKYSFINVTVVATVVTLGQARGKVMQYISPDLYFLCRKYLRFLT